ncbi:DUF3293 domain-containing protein [Paraneptunicella aestuarii]|uniref:DUF3293 domain-containing protein n=1 Tax=Paraneptunicella aestuarii TaxID=2831148 RepID=UPI001E46CD9C|nr:DUF3293 domain-containing protein [Paraneptunicella aestuarii]UAA39115.1 DUF3293 domain-containing protein [Paraneptunicella aestuarii]
MTDSELWKIYQKIVFYWHEAELTDGAFAIITAFNPHGKQLTEDENKSAHEKLKQQLLRNTGLVCEISGCSRDLSYQELSFAIQVSREKAMQLAKQWQQNGFYYVTQEGRLWLVPCLLNGMAETDMGWFKDYLVTLP